MTHLDYEILIVGGGPAGLSTWLHLNALAPELAKQSLVIEKSVYPREKLCGGGVTPLGELLLRGLGINLDGWGVSIDQIDFRFGESVRSLHRPTALRVVVREEFDHAIAQAAVRRGLNLHEGEAFVDMRLADGGLKVRTTEREYATRLLVGADGTNSTVRKRMGLTDGRLARLIDVITPAPRVSHSESAEPTAVFDFSAVAEGLQGYVWHFPCLIDGMPAVNRGIFDSRVHSDRDRADLRRILARVLEKLSLPVVPTLWKSHPVRWFSPEGRLSQPHVFLIGDAAGVDPLLGEGISPSLDYGDFAAHAIIEAFECGDFAFADVLERLIAHPVGQSLMVRREVAEDAYAPGMMDAEHLSTLLLPWMQTG